MNLKVYHVDTGIYDSLNFTVHIKPKKKFELTNFNFLPQISYSIKGPALELPLPTYSLEE